MEVRKKGRKKGNNENKKERDQRNIVCEEML